MPSPTLMSSTCLFGSSPPTNSSPFSPSKYLILESDETPTLQDYPFWRNELCLQSSSADACNVRLCVDERFRASVQWDEPKGLGEPILQSWPLPSSENTCSAHESKCVAPDFATSSPTMVWEDIDPAMLTVVNDRKELASLSSQLASEVLQHYQSPPQSPVSPQSSVSPPVSPQSPVSPHSPTSEPPVSPESSSLIESPQIQSGSQPSSARQARIPHRIKSANQTRPSKMVITSPDINSDITKPFLARDPPAHNVKVLIQSKTDLDKIVHREIRRWQVDTGNLTIRKGVRATECVGDESGFQVVERGTGTTTGTTTGIAKALATLGHAETPGNEIQCSDQCPTTFTELKDLARHLDRIRGPSHRPFVCSAKDCVWSVLGFPTTTECRNHICKSHSLVKFLCELCCIEGTTRQYSRPDALRRHINHSHSESELTAAPRKRKMKQRAGKKARRVNN